MVKSYKNHDIYITGHSLGGYLTQMASSEIVELKISNWRVAGFPYGDVVSLIGKVSGICKETSMTEI